MSSSSSSDTAAHDMVIRVRTPQSAETLDCAVPPNVVTIGDLRAHLHAQTDPRTAGASPMYGSLR
jgi:hypothetical protein